MGHTVLTIAAIAHQQYAQFIYIFCSKTEWNKNNNNNSSNGTHTHTPYTYAAPL